MGFIKGTIFCKSINSYIPPGCMLEMCLIDVPSSSEKNKPARFIGKLELNNPKSFPIKYDIEFDENDFKDASHNYYLKVNISKNDSSFYTNQNSNNYSTISANEYGDLISKGGRFRRHLDIFLDSSNSK